jgi:hypothetical protein
MQDLGRRDLLSLVSAGGLAAVTVVLIRATTADRDRVTRGTGRATSFGSVAVLGAVRRSRQGASQVTDTGHGLGHDDVDQGHGWPDLVRVRVEVHNGTRRDLLTSPGQFRLRVGPDGPTVSPFAWEHGPGALSARTTRAGWVDFLAPQEQELWVDFDDAGRVRPSAIPFRLAVARDV